MSHEVFAKVEGQIASVDSRHSSISLRPPHYSTHYSYLLTRYRGYFPGSLYLASALCIVRVQKSQGEVDTVDAMDLVDTAD